MVVERHAWRKHRIVQMVVLTERETLARILVDTELVKVRSQSDARFHRGQEGGSQGRKVSCMRVAGKTRKSDGRHAGSHENVPILPCL